ncbi:MAG: hypothetical protein O7D96_10980 [SAR324 cluster bacterium]|nr:hypothetical protein [SAR324 cluster bacterium]
MSATILSTGVALPEYVYPQEDVIRYVRDWLAHDPRKAAQAVSILSNAKVARRYAVRPAQWYLEHTSVTVRCEVYREEMVRLSESAARQALELSGVKAEEIGLIVTTSCTGIMIPPVESYLMNRMPLPSTVRRMPLTELGCVAGATALGHAGEMLRANPASAALVISAELASLTGQLEDFSLANIVAAALFGDGAAATVIVGEAHPRANGRGASQPSAPAAPPTGNGAGALHPTIVASRSVHFPDTLELMGFRNTDSGLKIFLSPRVPRFIRQELPRYLHPFLEEHGLRLADLRHFLLHPGGRKVLEGLERELGLTREETRLSWEVMRDYGNLSSATVLFLLHLFERSARPEPGDTGLLMAVGPGFAGELVLLRW